MKKHTLQICKDTRREIILSNIKKLYESLFYIRNEKYFINENDRKIQSEKLRTKIAIKEYEYKEFLKLNFNM